MLHVKIMITALFVVGSVNSASGEITFSGLFKSQNRINQEASCEKELREGLLYKASESQYLSRSGFTRVDVFNATPFSRNSSLSGVAYEYDVEVEGLWRFALLEPVSERKGRYSAGSPLEDIIPRNISDSSRLKLLGVIDDEKYEVYLSEQQRHDRNFFSATCLFYSDESINPNSISFSKKLYRR